MTATHDTHRGRTEPPSGPACDAVFDRTMQQLHAASLQQLTPSTLARLRTDRRAALSASHRAPLFGWGLASAAAAVCALAIGVAWLRTEPSPDAAPAQVAQAATDAGESTAGDALLAAEVEAVMAPLDEDPDLYLWLAANDDALPSIMER
ncbi:hypothetical protein [Marilutibacter chinensis]|uniref:Uncharacterized protein n=1 Tax=Marilutibacter chinensis TaxID=2912247 RepID=A0ABS9HU48_9GAMM|nr:hypothetical protein [Lysobacter chinensis]MCF7221892.1 hypothetical protein [Lysobacter chinensis]